MKHSLSLVFLAALAAFSVHAQRIPLINSGEVLSRATVLQDSQKYEGAIKELLTIPKRDTNYVTSLSRLAELYFLNKQMELSEATADAVLKHPSEFGAMMWRVKGSIYELKKEYDKGIGIVEAALKKYPFDVELLYLRGLLYHNKHDYKNAVRAYYDVLAVAPRSIGTHLNLGNLALWLGDRTHAMMSYGIYVTLRNQDNEKLQSLEKFVSNQVEWEGKGAAEKIDNNAYERLDQIMRANVAMDKKFKTEVLINIAAVKQYEMFFQQLNTASTSVDDPWTKFYGPIYSAIRDQKMVAPFLYHMLESSSLDEVTKWRSKHQRDLDKYYNMINPILIRSREMVVVPQSYNIPSPTHAEYDKNIIEGVGAMIGEQRTGRWIWLHRNGELSAEGNYSNGKKSGEWKYYSNSGFLLSSESPDTGETTEFYNDGSKQVHYFMKNDKVDGDIVFYYPCGSMSEKRTHKDGKRTGKSQMWYENGVLKSEFEYADDELTNTWTDYDERGKVTAKVAYKNGQRDGLFERFHPNGKLKDRYMYSAGKANGIAEAYHNNGVLKFKGQYTEETPVGLWIYQNRKGEKYEQRTYDSKGDLDKESILYSHGNIYEKYTYKNGSLIEIVWFDENGKESKKFGSPDGNFEGKHNFENGQVSSEGTYKNGKRDGKWTTYYLGGLVAATYNYVDGDFEGEQTDFYRSGKKYSVNEYKKGERDGYQQWFHENGQLSRHGWELKGNNQQQWLSYYADGTIEQDNYYRDGEPADTVYGFAVDGKLWARDFYENGEKTSETSFDGLQQILFNDAKTDGERTFPYQSGTIHTEYDVKCGKVNGPFQRMFPNGKVFYSTNYLNDERNGHYSSNDADGTPIAEGDYVSNSRSGIWKRYNRLGILHELTLYVDGEEDSLYTDYYAFGKPYQISEYSDGVLTGISRFLAPDGTPVAEKKYISDQIEAIRSTEKNGQFGPWRQFSSKMSVVAYYANGVKAYEEEYEAGTLSGAKRIYFSNGKLCREYFYVNGDNEGPFVQYYPNGKLCLKGQYHFDQLDGVVEAHNENGTLSKTITYKLGEMHGPTVYFKNGVKSMEVEFYNGLPLK